MRITRKKIKRKRTAYEEYAQNKRLSAQDARTRLVAESSSSAKTVTNKVKAVDFL